MLTPHVIKRDGCTVPFCSERIKEAIMRAALEAIVEEHLGETNGNNPFKFCRRRFVGFENSQIVLGLKREKRRVILFVSEWGVTERLVSAITSIKGYFSIPDMLAPVAAIHLLKASRRLARSPPLDPSLHA